MSNKVRKFNQTAHSLSLWVQTTRPYLYLSFHDGDLPWWGYSMVGIIHGGDIPWWGFSMVGIFYGGDIPWWGCSIVGIFHGEDIP